MKTYAGNFEFAKQVDDDFVGFSVDISYDCPEITIGSEKQIKWANSIRDENATKFLKLLAHARHFDNKTSNENADIYELFLSSNDARYWIHFQTSLRCDITRLTQFIKHRDYVWPEALELFKKYITK